MQRILALLLFVCVAVASLTGCTPQAPTVESDSNQSYQGENTIPVDPVYYRIKGTVAGEASSLTRQESPASGSTVVMGGYGSGSYFGPIESGKGYVRIKVLSVTPETTDASVGTVVILKSTDTKATALLSGDEVAFTCRRQYEAIAAVSDQEKFDEKIAGTWEFDYCRMQTSSVIPSER